MVVSQAESSSCQDASPLAVVERFNEAFLRHDIEATMAMMTDDCIFENTFPAPDGSRCSGQMEVRQEFTTFFENSPNAVFELEEQFSAGDRCIVRWIYRWNSEDGTPGHVRGVDIFKVRDGKVVEKLAYVKG